MTQAAVASSTHGLRRVLVKPSALALAVALHALAPAVGWSTTLVWNDGAGPFTGAATWSYDNGGTVATTDNPFTHVGTPTGAGGENVVLIGNGGEVTLNVDGQGPYFDNSLYELRVGTMAAEANLSAVTGGANYQGTGVLNVDGVGLILFNDGTGTGNLIVGGAAGISGTVNWNSNQTLVANGQLRVGQGGSGLFNQNGGRVEVATTAAASQPARIGSGSSGVYNLNSGVLQIGSADNGTGIESVAPLEIGTGAGSAGTFNLGDNTGAAKSSTLETWGNVLLNGPAGTLNLKSDGQLIVHYAPAVGSSSQIRLGAGGGGYGEINQTGGSILADGLMSLGFNTGTAVYNLNGSTGSVHVRALEVFQNAAINFALDAGGATTINVDGGASAAGDTAAGNSVTLSNPSLNITGLSTYSSLADIVLFNQADPTASLSGSFGNYVQGAVVGQNSGGANFYLNYYGGSGNDIVLQSTLPSSSTDGLVWNTAAANFGAGWASGNGSFGVGAFPVNPLSGLQSLYLGNNGVATFDDTTNTASGTMVQNVFIGTNKSGAVVAGRSGNGVLTVSGAQNLTVDDAAASGAKGFFTVGEQGFTGTVNWNSTGTLDAQGQFRVGRDGGSGLFNQNNGVVKGGTTGGGGKYLAIGDGVGSTGVYNLNNGFLYPDGQGVGVARRQFRVGENGATGTLRVGDGAGAAGSAVFESEDDLWVGSTSGVGTMEIKSDGVVRLLTDEAPLFVGYLSGGKSGQGTVVQTGGSVVMNALFSIGQGAGSVGQYNFTGGTIAAADDGGGDVRIGGGGGNGVMRVSGSAGFSTKGNLFIAEGGGQGTVGRLELTGSQATFAVNRLENAPGTAGSALGNNETIRWVADANGVTPIVVNGTSGTQFVQIQDPAEVTANTGANGSGNLMGDGIALELDLSALVGNHTLTLINNLSTEAVIGFFENGTTRNLYEEGESILGTGFGGTVSISYLGGTGNDVVLSLVASNILFGDYNNNGLVDAADYTVWRDNLGASITLPGEDPSQTPGHVTQEDFTVWKNNYGRSSSPSASDAASVPEPSSLAAAALALAVVAFRRRIR